MHFGTMLKFSHRFTKNFPTHTFPHSHSHAHSLVIHMI